MPFPPSGLVFGPVIERVISTQNCDEQGLVFFSMASGKPLKPPFPLKRHPNQLPDIVEVTPELKQWVKANDADILFHLGDKTFERMNLEMREADVARFDQWESVSPEDVVEFFVKEDAARMVNGYMTGSEGPHDYRQRETGGVLAFRTRTKLMGAYQYVGVDNDMVRGVWIRYKLVQPPSQGPLQISPLPPGWKLEYSGENGIDFYSVLPRPEGSGVLMFSRWPPASKPEDIPALVRKIADGFLESARSRLGSRWTARSTTLNSLSAITARGAMPSSGLRVQACRQCS